MRKTVFIFMFFLVLGAIPRLAWAEELFNDNIFAIYSVRCAHCHGLEGKGDGPSSHIMDPKPTNFVTVQVQNDYVGTIEAVIANGRSSMPAFKNILTRQEIKELGKFINSLRSK